MMDVLHGKQLLAGHIGCVLFAISNGKVLALNVGIILADLNERKEKI